MHDGSGPRCVVKLFHSEKHARWICSFKQVYIRQLKSNLIGKLATVRGTVVRMSPIRPLITSIEFTCKKCGRMIVCNFEDGRYTPPQKCTMIGCRNRSFTPQLGDAQSIDYQKIRIQEILGADKEVSTGFENPCSCWIYHSLKSYYEHA